jgi:hypothetical protein
VQVRDADGVEAAAIADVVDLAGKRVPEVGCGGGRLTSFAASIYAACASRFTAPRRRSFVVSDTFDTGGFLEVVPEWRGTEVSDELRRRAAAAVGPLAVHQDIRLRLLRALEPV